MLQQRVKLQMSAVVCVLACGVSVGVVAAAQSERFTEDGREAILAAAAALTPDRIPELR